MAALAFWEAARDYDPALGGQFERFLSGRVNARVLTRYRQEWRYAARFPPLVSGDDPDGDADRPARGGCPCPLAEDGTVCERVRDLLDSLPAGDRDLLVALFWHGRTEAELGRQLGITQRAVNKRKHAAFVSLARADRAEK